MDLGSGEVEGVAFVLGGGDVARIVADGAAGVQAGLARSKDGVGGGGVNVKWQSEGGGG